MESLHKEFARLNTKQKVAVEEAGNTVVFAGPGSGKTATLVLKAAYLLAQIIPPPRGLACITYNNEAASEFRNRLEGLGVRASGRVFLGTLHSFCLNCIIRPFAPLVDFGTSDIGVITDPRASEFLKSAANKVGPDLHPFDLKEMITKLRSRVACQEDYSGFADSDLEILQLYQQALKSESLVDFEGIVEQALEIIQSSEKMLGFEISLRPDFLGFWLMNTKTSAGLFIKSLRNWSRGVFGSSRSATQISASMISPALNPATSWNSRRGRTSKRFV